MRKFYSCLSLDHHGRNACPLWSSSLQRRFYEFMVLLPTCPVALSREFDYLIFLGTFLHYWPVLVACQVLNSCHTVGKGNDRFLYSYKVQRLKAMGLILIFACSFRIPAACFSLKFFQVMPSNTTQQDLGTSLRLFFHYGDALTLMDRSWEDLHYGDWQITCTSHILFLPVSYSVLSLEFWPGLSQSSCLSAGFLC